MEIAKLNTNDATIGLRIRTIGRMNGLSVDIAAVMRPALHLPQQASNRLAHTCHVAKPSSPW
jgi:hypothetical protein